MATIYPAQIDTTQSLPTVVDLQTPVQALVFNQLRDAVVAIEGALGTVPGSNFGTVSGRFANIENSLANITNIFGIDLQESVGGQFVVGLRGNPISTATPVAGQFLGWNGLSWGPTSYRLDISGSALGQTVVALQGRPLSNAAPATGQVLEWNGSAWIPGVAGGDLSGNYGSQTVVGLQGTPISSTPPITNQYLQYNGSKWTPMTISPGFTAGGDLSGSTSSQTVIGIQGQPVLSTTPTTGQLLEYNGTQWAPTTVINSGVANTQVLFDDSGVINGSSHLTYTKTTGGLAVEADGTGFISIGNTTMPSTGDMQVNGSFALNANNGVNDVTLLNYDTTSDIVALGSNTDLVSNVIGNVSIYPFGTLGLGISDNTYAYMEASNPGVFQIYNTTALQIGTISIQNPALTGQIRLANAATINVRNNANLADITALSTDTSDNVIVGDSSVTNNAIIRSSDLVAFQPGGALFQQASNGVITVSQSSATLTGTSDGQMIFDTNSRPVCADSANNRMQMAAVVQTLANNAGTVSLTATPTNLSFAAKANDVWVVNVFGRTNFGAQGAIAIGAPSGTVINSGQVTVTAGFGTSPTYDTAEINSINTLSNLVGGGVGIINISFQVTIGSTAGNITIESATNNVSHSAIILAGTTMIAYQAVQV